MKSWLFESIKKTIFAGQNGVWRSPASASALGAEGRRFESCHPDLVDVHEYLEIMQKECGNRELFNDSEFQSAVTVSALLFLITGFIYFYFGFPQSNLPFSGYQEDVDLGSGPAELYNQFA